MLSSIVRLIQRKNSVTTLFFLLFSFFVLVNSYGFDEVINKGSKEYLLLSNSSTYDGGIGVPLYKDLDHKLDQNQSSDSLHVLKEVAFYYAKINQSKPACEFIEKYIKSTGDVDFITHSKFDHLSDNEVFIVLGKKYLQQFSWSAVFCFYVAFVGLFISIVLNFRVHSDRLANFLMSLLVFVYSCYMFFVGLDFMNYEYYFPDLWYLSDGLFLLCGPIMYFYFKRISVKYQFKFLDILHLLPVLGFVMLLFPVYLLSSEEKVKMIIDYDKPYFVLVFVVKFLSLVSYGVYSVKVYLKDKEENIAYSFLKKQNLMKSILVLYSIYTVVYFVDEIFKIYKLTGDEVLFGVSVIVVAALILYISFSAFINPSLFGEIGVIKKPTVEESVESKNDKYKKSGLTTSLSLELKVKLLHLLKEEKIYKQNDITLQRLSMLLDTTRHNTSQIINEHFGLNFFELINKYRIEEAKRLLQEEKYRKFNIIDIAYEVGFNNKVTFNKSFKKYNKITPSEYLKRIVA